jgi:hypothetical protein
MIRMGRRMDPGTRRRGFVIPVPHTRAAQKNVQGYIHTLRPMVEDIAAALEVDRAALADLDEPDAIGAVYLRAFLDDLGRHLGA